MDILLEKEISQVRVVESNRQYWFIRTFGGLLYEYFYEHNFVGLGFNTVPFKYIQEARLETEATYNRLQNFIASNTEYKKGEATKWANQLISFEHEIKIDDIVIIPSESSNYLGVGIVVSDTYVTEVKETFVFDGKYEPYPEKRRRVKWLKQIPKEEFRGDLKGMFFSRMAVTNVNDYSEVIEGNLSTLYIKDELIHLTIKIDQDEEINAFELQRFLNGLTFFYKELCYEYGIEENEDLYIKIKVQSKGGMFLKAIGIAAVVSIAGAIALSDNMDVKMDLGNFGKVEGKSTGLIKSWSNFLDAKETRKQNAEKAAQERKIEWIKFMDSRMRLKAKPVQDSVTKEQDNLDDKTTE